MTDNTINNDLTMGGATATLLAGRYRVVRQLGQGGMGSVWLVDDTQLDNKPFAVKMLPSVLVSNKRAYRQLKDEAIVAMKLVHPNIVQIRAFEENNGNPFLVMDYIEGQTLDDYLAEKGKLSEDEAIRLLKPVAAALDYAHTQGVVHRDVKPGNVMIRKDGVPFVLDFGIAREIQETMTRVTGKLSSGTLLYMSPEQLNGDAPKPAQDIYSFAAMAYECLKGEPPFSRGQVEFQILNKEPEPLLCGSALSKAILRGLAKSPAARPASCKGVVTPVMVFRPRMRCLARPHLAAPRRAPSVSGSDGSGRAKWIVLSVFAIVACIAGVVKLSAPEAPPRPKTASPVVRPSAEPLRPSPEKVAAEEASAKALAQFEICRRIDRADGFGGRIEECGKAIARGQSAFDGEDWPGAAKFYSEAIRQCALVIEMNADRDRAREAAAAMEEQMRAATKAEADKYAKERFEAAKKQAAQARQEFAAMQFGGAAIEYGRAEQLFGEVALEAIGNKARKEKVEEERQRRERLAKQTPSRQEAAAEASKLKIGNELVEVGETPQKQTCWGWQSLKLKDVEKTPRTQQVSSISRTYAYTVRLVPYVMEGGEKKYVAVEATCGEPSVAVWSCQDSGRMIVVAGSNVRQTGLISVKLKTEDGTRSGRKWLGARDFTSDSSPREIEVELK